MEEKIKKQKTKDMTSGSPLKLIFSFALPLIVGQLFQQLYNMVDMIIVGRCVGVDALAGVGSTGSIIFFIIGSCTGICSGFAVPVAQQFGAKNESRMRQYVANAAWLGISFAAVMTLVVILLGENILIWMNTPEDIFDYAYSYIIIIFMGIPTVFLYNLTAGIIRALGDSKTPLYFLMFSSVLNVLLDLFCIVVLDMGVAGASTATVASQLISGLLCLVYMIKKYPVLKLNRDELKIRPRLMWNLCTMGVPMGLQFSITAIGSVAVQTAVNGFGSSVVAAVATGQKINNLFATPCEATGIAMATYSGQNTGAGRLDRVKQGMFSAGIITSVYSVFALILQWAVGRDIALLFLQTADGNVLDLSMQFMMSSACFYIPLGFVCSVRSLIQGMGFGAFSVLSGVFEMVARVGVAKGLVPMFGFTAICFAHPAAWVAADLFLFPAFFWCRRVLERKIKPRTA